MTRQSSYFGSFSSLLFGLLLSSCQPADEDSAAGNAPADDVDDVSADGGAPQQDAAPNGDLDQTCAALETNAAPTPANLLFVIDQSGSMNEPAAGDGQGRSKWEVTRDTLLESLDTFVNAPNVKVGLTLFPTADPILQCRIQDSPNLAIKKLSEAHHASIREQLMNAEPLGDTPIGGTLMNTYEYLRKAIAEDKSLEGNSYVVLFTDGAETCDQTAMQGLVNGAVELATRFRIKTFAIGAPGSEGERLRLSQVAFAGETPIAPDCDHETTSGNCHYDMSAQADYAKALADAFLAISSDKRFSCEFDMPTGRSIDPTLVNVKYTASTGGEAETIFQDDSAACAQANGWQYGDSLNQIRFCGDICERVRNDPTGEVKIQLGCRTVVR